MLHPSGTVAATDGKLLSVFLSFMSLRTPDGAWGERNASLVFLFGLLLLVACGLMLAWELGQAPVTAERLATWTP
jgi:hypothetical protein